MKKLILLSALLIFSIINELYSQNALINIENEAYKEFRKNGGTNNQWIDYKSEIIQRYKAKYYSGNQGQSTKDALKSLNKYQNQMQMRRNGTNHQYNPNSPKYNPKYTKGTITFSNGQNASFKNGQVSNWMGKTIGYFNKGTFIDSYQRCIGFVKGNNIYNCNGNVIANVQNGNVYSQGYVLYTINGDILTSSNNYNSVEISGIDMGSLAAYLLFFHR